MIVPLPSDSTGRSGPTALWGFYPAFLAVLFVTFWVLLAIRPVYREDWAVENVLPVLGFGLLVLTWKRLSFSPLSYTLIFIFFCLHEIGAHYTYSEVPYDAWYRSVTGTSLDSLLGWQRNNYDRAVHFAFGLLIAVPVLEVTRRLTGRRGAWAWIVPISLFMSASMLYELIEWAAALVFGGDLGMAYLGTQGDPWDGQKDMALASLGAAITVTVASIFAAKPR